MQNKFSILIFAIPMCFFTGVWWGYKKQFNKHHQNIISISVLSQPKIIPNEILDHLLLKQNTKINLTTYSNTEELTKLLKSENTEFDFDIVLMNSQLTSTLLPEELFIKPQNVNQNSIFKDAPNELWAPYSTILGWSLNAYQIQSNLNQKTKADSIILKTINDPSILAEALTLIEPSAIKWIRNENTEALTALFKKIKFLSKESQSQADIVALPISGFKGTKEFTLLSRQKKSNLQLLIGLIHSSARQPQAAEKLLNYLSSQQAQSILFSNSLFSGVNMKSYRSNEDPQILKKLPLDKYAIKNDASVFSSFWQNFVSNLNLNIH